MAEHTRFEQLVAYAKKNITEISPQDAAAKSNSGEAVIVDVREKDEWEKEHIPGAIHLSRGTIELDIDDKVTEGAIMSIFTFRAIQRLRSLAGRQNARHIWISLNNSA